MNSRQDNETAHLAEKGDIPMRMIKLRVPVEEFPPGVNIIGILLGQRGATRKRLEEFSGCTIKVQGKGVRDDSCFAENERLHLQVRYRFPTQLDKLSDAIFALAQRAWNFTGDNAAKVASASNTAQTLNAERMSWMDSTASQSSKFISAVPSTECEKLQQEISIGKSISHSHCFNQDRLNLSFPTQKRDVAFSPHSSLTFLKSRKKEIKAFVHPLVLWKFHKMLLSNRKVPAVELKSRYEEFHDEALVLAMFGDLSQGIEQCLAIYNKIFEVDIKTETVSTKLSANLSFDEFQKIIALHDIRTIQESVSRERFVNTNVLAQGRSVDTNVCSAVTTGASSTDLGNFPVISNLSQRQVDTKKETDAFFEIPEINAVFPLTLKSLCLQLLHRTLVKSGKPLPLENIYKMFEQHWGITFNPYEIGEESLLKFLLKYPGVFFLQSSSSEDDSHLVLPIYQPNFAAVL